MATTRVILNYPWNNGKFSKTTADTNDYILCEKILEIARQELREDEAIREQSLQNFYAWINKNGDIKNVRCDDNFLLRFLRVKKFSLPMAQQTLLKYLNLRKTFPEMATKLDFLDPVLNDLITRGYIFPSPIKDKNGRRVILAFAQNIDPSQHTSADMTRAHFLTYEALLEDEENQILGFVHVGDLKGFTTAHITCWNPTDFGRIMKWGEQSLPMRHKEIHCVHAPAAVKIVIDFALSRVSGKIKDRLQIHVALNDLHKKVEKKCLPKELGGTIPMSDMIELWKHELMSKRERMLDLDNMKILSDRGIISRRDKNNNFDSEAVTGSFRKLEVD